jgi:uncharacterized integral membrane protein (TIGR00697 family)
MLASWVAFLISENIDAYLFAWFKKKTNGKYLWMRNVFSSIPAMAIDTVVFVFIAFLPFRNIDLLVCNSFRRLFRSFDALATALTASWIDPIFTASKYSKLTVIFFYFTPFTNSTHMAPFGCHTTL